MLLTFDFHNHSCLSPCAQLENSPENMAERARRRGIDLFAITDHNSALNAPAFAVACARAGDDGRRADQDTARDTASAPAGPIPLFGLELSPFEEAHLLVLFPDPLSALSFSDWVRNYLPEQSTDPRLFGDQVVVDPENNILSMPSAWFGNPLRESFRFFAEAAADAGALVIPAHVDRAQFSVYSQLGFLPEGPYDAVEAFGRKPDASLCHNHCVISGSDAHVLEHIGRRSSSLELEDTDENRALIQSLRTRLARMAKAWEGAKASGGAVAIKTVREDGAALDSDDPQTDETICMESFSTKIPDMAPLVEFLGKWYPRAEAASVIAAIRSALRGGRAWSVYTLPRVVAQSLGPAQRETDGFFHRQQGEER